MKYALPECLSGRTTQTQYNRWLQRKAAAHVRRDRGSATVARYKEAIHAAVCANGDRDFYTGEPLDWSIISKWRNADSTAGKKKYKRQFAKLPTVDHTLDEQGHLKFVICSWQVNDAKGDLSLEEFYALCESVLRQRDSETVRRTHNASQA